MPHLVSTFAALADQTRFMIVERLLNEGELSAGCLTENSGISAPAISRHLKVLRHAGVIHQRVDKQRRLYTASPETLQTITAWTMSHRKFWQASLDRLEAALNNMQESEK